MRTPRSALSSGFTLSPLFAACLLTPPTAPAQEIHKAAQRGDLARVQALLKENPELITRQDDLQRHQ